MELVERCGLRKVIYNINNEDNTINTIEEREKLISLNPITTVFRILLFFKRLFITVFLPEGYPDTVSSDYLTYQIFDTLQALCSSITGLLATQAILQFVSINRIFALKF